MDILGEQFAKTYGVEHVFENASMMLVFSISELNSTCQNSTALQQRSVLNRANEHGQTRID